MEASAFIKNANGVETPKTCPWCVSSCDDLELLPNDKSGQYRFRKLTNLLPGVPSFLCTNCESRLDKMCAFRCRGNKNFGLVNGFTEKQNTVKNEADISKDHLGHSVEQTVGTELLIKTEVTTPNAAHDLPLIQRSCTASELICQDREDSPAPTNTCANDSASESIRSGIAAIDAGINLKVGQKRKNDQDKTLHRLGSYKHRSHQQSENQQNHILIHTGEKPFMCEICGLTFSFLTNLTRHKKIHNMDEYKQCPHCPLKFPLSSSLKEHIRVHTGERPFVCQVCVKGFRTSSNLAQHKKIHNKDQQYQCPHCPYVFARLFNLNNHIRIHTDEKPCVCEVCDQAFRSLSNLAQHKKIHNKDQQHQCPHCPSTYTQLFNLNNHMRTHTGEKPFVCNICKKAFHSSPALASHSKSHKKRCAFVSVEESRSHSYR